MCGILGIISQRPEQRLASDSVISMRDSMTDRGPDDAGLFEYRAITLAHRRLAIRDLGHGRQPWLSYDQRFALVYNGELFNDEELRRELRHERGIEFRTRCDTETLAEAWAAWGPTCVARLRGMFAFGMVELASGKTWLVRDRFGIKPLFYTLINGQLVFASTIRAIRQHPQFSSKPNLTAVSHYLKTLRSTLGQQTLFQNVFTLRPAEMLEFQQGRFSRQIYWSLPFPSQDGTIEFEDAADEIEAVLRDSVDAHVTSDVEVGMMLSGGVDSNTLATMTRDRLGRSITGVCGGGADANADGDDSDFRFARTCADHLGFDYGEAQISDVDYHRSWQTLVRDWQLPLTTPTDAVIFQIAKQLRQSCGVVLGGEGADEAFCGYAIQHWSGSDYDRSRNPKALGTVAEQEFRASLRRSYGVEHFDSIAEHYLMTNQLIPVGAQSMLLQSLPDDTRSEIRSYYEHEFSQHGNVSAQEQYVGVLLKVNLESLLRRLDMATMAASLEARVPFADHRVVEAAARLPLAYKIDVAPEERQPWLTSMELAQRGSLRSKRVLREVASGLLPSELAMRPKQSFPTPLVSWLGGSYRSWANDLLTNSRFAKQMFHTSALREMAQLPDALRLWQWPVLNLILWGEECF